MERQEIEDEFGRYQLALVEGQVKKLREEMRTMQVNNPDLESFAAEQVKEELLAIESDTYAEFIRAGQIKDELAPLLQDVLTS